MSAAQTRSDVVALLDRHGRTPRKKLGQHFLADPNLARKIVADAQLRPGSPVLEIGTGTGALTAVLAEAGHRVLSYEVDSALEPLLAESLQGLNVDVRFEDAMSVDFGAKLDRGPWALVANLPYNVGTPLLLRLLREVDQITTFVVMVQREVADRLIAEPGSRVYGIPSVVAQIHSRRLGWFSVPPQVFVPPPAVSSAVVHLARVEAPPLANRAIELAGAAFGQRRKMLRSALRSVIDDLASTLERAGLEPTARAEELSPSDYIRLAEAEAVDGIK